MLADGRLDFKPLISHRFAIEAAAEAYELISSGNPLGVLLEYASDNSDAPLQRSIEIRPATTSTNPSAVKLSFIGAGNYASSVLIPAFAATKRNW